MEDNLTDYVTRGFARIKQDQATSQAAGDQDRLAKSLVRLQRHFGIETQAGVDRLHKSVTDVEDDEDQAALRRRRIAAGRERSRSQGHEPELEAPVEDEAPDYSKEPIPVDGPEFQPLAWRVAAREHAILQAGVVDAQDRINVEKRMQQARARRPESRRSR